MTVPGDSKLGVVAPRHAAEPLTWQGAAPRCIPDAAARQPKRQRRHVERFRTDDAERAALHARVRESGLSVGAYLRKCSLGQAGPRSRRRRPEIDVALLARNNAALNRIGNNLNQVARALNRDDPERQSVDELRAALLATLAANRRALGHDCEG
jgi:Mobilization protein NikA